MKDGVGKRQKLERWRNISISDPENSPCRQRHPEVTQSLASRTQFRPVSTETCSKKYFILAQGFQCFKGDICLKDFTVFAQSWVSEGVPAAEEPSRWVFSGLPLLEKAINFR